MARHHYLNASSFRHYSSDLLRNQIESSLGRAGTQAEAATAIDWELAGVRSRPQDPFASAGNPVERESLDREIVEASRSDEPFTGKSQARRRRFDIAGQSQEVKQASESEMLQQTIYREARRLTELSPQMSTAKNLHENRLLQEYMEEKFD